MFSAAKLYICVGLIAASFAAGALVSHKFHKAATVTAQEKAIKKHDKQVKKDVKIIGKAETKKEIVKVKYKTIIKKVPYVKAPECTFDGEFVQLWNSANRLHQ